MYSSLSLLHMSLSLSRAVAVVGSTKWIAHTCPSLFALDAKYIDWNRMDYYLHSGGDALAGFDQYCVLCMTPGFDSSGLGAGSTKDREIRIHRILSFRWSNQGWGGSGQHYIWFRDSANGLWTGKVHRATIHDL